MTDMSELLISEPVSLATGSQKNGPSSCVIELTINFPRTKSFLSATSEQQKKIYRKVYHYVLHTFGPIAPESVQTFEFCKDGQVHLHAQIYWEFARQHFPAGVVSDIVKTYLKLIPKKYSAYKPGALVWYPNGYRYADKGLTVQYIYPENTTRIEEWLRYIRKDE